MVSGVCDGLSSLPTDTVTGYEAPLGVEQETPTTVFSAIFIAFTPDPNLNVGAGRDAGDRMSKEQKKTY